MRTVWVEGGPISVTGREGHIYPTTMADPPYMVGERVSIDGKRTRIMAIERHPLPNDAGLAPGAKVGLLVVPMSHIGQ